VVEYVSDVASTLLFPEASLALRFSALRHACKLECPATVPLTICFMHAIPVIRSAVVAVRYLLLAAEQVDG
jgi:hypothetical protein